METIQLSLIDKISHAVAYYLVLKRNEVVIYTTARMDLGNIMLREKGQPQKTNSSESQDLIGVKYPEIQYSFEANHFSVAKVTSANHSTLLEP